MENYELKKQNMICDIKQKPELSLLVLNDRDYFVIAETYKSTAT